MSSKYEEYQKTSWVNDQTKLNATNMNKIEEGIEDTRENTLDLKNSLDELLTALLSKMTFTYDDITKKLYFSFGDAETANVQQSFEIPIPMNSKVDVIANKGLSTEDYTTAEKTKLSGIEAGAEVNVQPDYNQSDSTQDDYIKNKPNLTIYALKSIKINNHTLEADVTVSKSDVGLGSVENTGDSATPVEGGTTKFTTGGAYTELAKKVDKVSGKGLSTNDYTTTEKNKLAGIESGAQVNTVTGIKGNSEESYRTGNVNITKSNIGLGNVDNTSDANKPISTATQTALNSKANSSDLSTHTGNTSNPHSVTKSQVGLGNVDNKSVATIKSEFTGSIADDNTGFVTGDAVYSHTSNKSNPHEVTKAQVGLGNVDNTSDANKPVSTATQTALDGKVDKVTGKGLSKNDFTDTYKAYVDANNDKVSANNAKITIQKNGTKVSDFTLNQSSAQTINITVPTSASDVSALPSSTKYATAISLSIDSTTYEVTAQLKDQDGNDLGTAQVIDLPLESVVVNGSYDDTNKKIILTLQSGTTIDVSVSDIINGLQSELSSTNKLNADYVENGTTNKVYTSTEKTKLSGIASGAQVNVIESVTINGGSPLTVTSKNIDLPAYPTKSSLGLGNVDNKSEATIKSDLTGSIEDNNTGFVTGDAVYDALSNKVDKVNGKGLSTNDYDATEKGKVASNTSARHTHSNKALLDTYEQSETNLADAVSKKHSHSNKSLLDTYEQTETDLADAVSKKHSHSNKSLLDTYTQTESDLASAVADDHTHSNKDLLDTYEQTEADLADAVSKKHSHSNQSLLDTYEQTEVNLADAVSKKHSHSNQSLLDTYTQTETNLADAVSKKHSHSNKSTLDDITAAYTSEEKTKLGGIASGAQVNVLEGVKVTDISGTTSELTATSKKVTIDLSGLQTKIDSTHQLSSDLVDDNNHTHKFVTAAEKTKLSGIASGAQVNVLEGVQVNGTDLTITNKKVNIEIPTDVGATQLSYESSTGVLSLLDSSDTVLDTVNLPLELVVDSGFYDSTTEEVVLQLNSYVQSSTQPTSSTFKTNYYYTKSGSTYTLASSWSSGTTYYNKTEIRIPVSSLITEHSFDSTYLSETRVTNGQSTVTFSTAFINRITSLESSVSTNTSDITQLKKSPISLVTDTSSTSKTIKPNIYYDFGGRNGGTLTITLDTAYANLLNEYMFEILADENNFTLTTPSDIIWSENEHVTNSSNVLTLEAKYSYQFSIVNKRGLIVAFENGKLTTPTVSISNGVLSWSSIANAESYDVTHNGTTHNTSSTTFDLKTYHAPNGTLTTPATLTSSTVIKTQGDTTSTLQITCSASSGSYSSDDIDHFEIYYNGTTVTTTGTSSKSISVPNGNTYTITTKAIAKSNTITATVKAKSTKFTDSDSSTSKSYTYKVKNDSATSSAYSITIPYTIAFSLTNITKTSGSTTILPNGSANIVISANSGYELPSSITVTNATLSSYNSSTGEILISNPTGKVTITASGVANAPTYNTIYLKRYWSDGSASYKLNNGSEVALTTSNQELTLSNVSKLEVYMSCDDIGQINVDTSSFKDRNSNGDLYYTSNTGWTDITQYLQEGCYVSINPND